MSDEALIAACAVGETAALGALFDRHADAVYRLLARIAIADRHEIDDLVQSTFIEVWRSAARFGGRGTPRSWIFGIAANVARRHVRGEIRRRVAMESARAASHEAAEAAPRPDVLAARRELVGRIGDALQALPHDLRVAFVLCDLEGIPGVDAARAVGVRQGTMWRRLHDARKRLRASLQGGES